MGHRKRIIQKISKFQYLIKWLEWKWKIAIFGSKKNYIFIAISISYTFREFSIYYEVSAESRLLPYIQSVA